MARIASQEKMGFYPTPQVVVDLIKTCLTRSSNGKIRVLDPCAGTGDPVAQIASHLQAESFGVELDKKRAEQVRQRVDKAIWGDTLRVSVRSGSMSCLFLNPPYDYDESGRIEQKFIVHSAPSLQAGGVLVLVVSIRSLNLAMRRYLASWFTELKMGRFPDGEFEKFKQVVLFGRKKANGVLDNVLMNALEGARVAAGFEVLQAGKFVYQVPVAMLPDKLFHFRNLEMTAEEMVRELEEDGFDRQIFDLVSKRDGNARIRPAAPLRKGHLAILVASGMTDGLVEKDEKRLLIKGTVRKEKRRTVETDETNQTVTELDVLKIEIVGLDLKTGDVFSIK